jgi:mRNA-degrading endonuclease toxin of MazEF toxin-antitoxin module
MPPTTRSPLRGEIWFVQLQTDPPAKGRRPVVVVSLDARNRHVRADTVLVVPLTTSTHKEVPTHVYLAAGETGLSADSAARVEDITVVRKQSLVEPGGRLRRLSNSRICELASKVLIATGCAP